MFVFEEASGSAGDVPSFFEFSISGETFEPKGDITMRSRLVNMDDFPALREMATVCSMCNEASVDYNEASSNYNVFLRFRRRLLFLLQWSCSSLMVETEPEFSSLSFILLHSYDCFEVFLFATSRSPQNSTEKGVNFLRVNLADKYNTQTSLQLFSLHHSIYKHFELVFFRYWKQ